MLKTSALYLNNLNKFILFRTHYFERFKNFTELAPLYIIDVLVPDQTNSVRDKTHT
jgi:hypothetical protein